jgi:hypothetical protein
MKTTVRTEHEEQVLLFEWIALHIPRHPELECISASANGLYSTPTHVARAKKAGLSPGYPDIIVDVPAQGYAGLRIELKRTKGGRLRPEQKVWRDRLQSQGYRYLVCKGYLAAWHEIASYLGIKMDMSGAKRGHVRG